MIFGDTSKIIPIQQVETQLLIRRVFFPSKMSFKCLVTVLWLQAERDVHILHCLWLAHVLGFVVLGAGSREEAQSQSGYSQ